MSSMNTYRKLLPAVLILALITPGISQAALNKFVPNENVVVSFADLDLSRDDAVLALYQRLQKAANEACANDYHGIGPRIIATRIRNLTRGCSEEALDNAVKQVNNPGLTDLHNRVHVKNTVTDR